MVLERTTWGVFWPHLQVQQLWLNKCQFSIHNHRDRNAIFYNKRVKNSPHHHCLDYKTPHWPLNVWLLNVRLKKSSRVLNGHPECAPTYCTAMNLFHYLFCNAVHMDSSQTWLMLVGHKLPNYMCSRHLSCILKYLTENKTKSIARFSFSPTTNTLYFPTSAVPLTRLIISFLSSINKHSNPNPIQTSCLETG